MSDLPTPPFWFAQRQCKAEPVGSENVLKVSGPNLGEAYLCIEKSDKNMWKASLRLDPAGPDVRATEPEIAAIQEAWNAAFELFRLQVIA